MIVNNMNDNFKYNADLNADYFCEDLDTDIDLRKNPIKYDNKTRMIYTPRSLQSRIPDMNITDIAQVETIVVDDEGTRTVTRKRVEIFFSTEETTLHEHDLYHITYYKNVEGYSEDPNCQNYWDKQGSVVRPPTSIMLNGSFYSLS